MTIGSEIHGITIIKSDLSAFEVKLAKSLKKHGYIVNSITLYQPNRDQEKIFDTTFYLLKRDLVYKKKFIDKIKKLFLLSINLFRNFLHFKQIKNPIAIGVAGQNWFITLFFILLNKRFKRKIYFPYDIAFFRYNNYKIYPIYERLGEKYNFRNCDGIIHKGPEDELNYLPKDFQATGKPALQFLPYCDEESFIPINDDFFSNKLSKKDGKIHLVYVGGIKLADSGNTPTSKIFSKIINQGLHLDAYVTNYKKLEKDQDFMKLKNTNLFKLHKPIYNKNFQKVLSKYDWGIYIFYNNFRNYKTIWADTAFGNKISSYLEAGVPIIANSELKFVCKIIKENKFGIIVDRPEEIIKSIKNINYNKLVENLKKHRKKFTMESNIHKLMKFFEECCT